MNETYIKELEKQNEVLQKKLSFYEGHKHTWLMDELSRFLQKNLNTLLEGMRDNPGKELVMHVCVPQIADSILLVRYSGNSFSISVAEKP